MRIRVGRPSAAMVVSVIALSVAMGGTGYAAATIGSAQITDNSIRNRDVRNETLKSGDIRDETLRTWDVADDTLTGEDVNESTLGKVPSAAGVDDFVTFNVAMNRGDARTRLAVLGPVTLYGTCDEDAGNAHGYVQAETTAEHTYTYNDGDLNPGEVVDIDDESGPADAGNFGNYSGYEPMFFSGQAGGSFDYDGEAGGIIIGGPGAECRFVGSIPLIPAG